MAIRSRPKRVRIPVSIEHFADPSGTADGVPLTVTLDLRDGCEPAAGMAVYMWHCDREGRYSLYSTGLPGRTSYAAGTSPLSVPRGRVSPPASGNKSVLRRVHHYRNHA